MTTPGRLQIFSQLSAVLLCVALVAGSLATPARAQDTTEVQYATLTFDPPLGEGPVYVVPVTGMIDNELARYLARAIDDAEGAEAAAMIFHINTFGGLLDAADKIRKSILSAEVPTIAYIDPNAASAGALISYAADRIVMAPGGSIGAATVVEGVGGKAAPDKYQSYMRGLMRATAEAKGRDPSIAEAMVDETIEVEGVSEAGKVLTLSSEEAERLGVADAVIADVEQVRAALSLEQAAVVQHRATWAERLLRFLASPVMQSLLMLMMMGGLYFELQTPGVGFAGSIAAIGAALFFAPHYMLGLVESWEIVLFGLGVVLIFAEIFVIPGFGVAGVSGLVLVVGSLMAALVANVGLSFPPVEAFSSAVLTMAATMVLLVVLIFSLGRYLPQSDRFGQLVLAGEMTSATGYTSADTADTLLGQGGRTITPLRPSGMAEIGDTRVDVITAGEYIPAGEAVQVVRVRGSRVEVRAVRSLSAEGETSLA